MAVRVAQSLLIALATFGFACAVPSKVVTATFVPPAAPTIASTHAAGPEATLIARRHAIATGYGVDQRTASQTRPQNIAFKPLKSACKGSRSALFAKKKSAGVTKKGGKIQVKLLKFVQGTGNVGDVVMVAPAFFENKLKRTNSAVAVTDDEVAAENEANEASKKEKLDSALEMQKKIQGTTVQIAKKAGPEGHLFGGVGKKDIFTQLKKKFPKGALTSKQIRIVSIKGEDGKDIGKHDIKNVGEFSSTISLLSDVDAEFTVIVTAES